MGDQSWKDSAVRVNKFKNKYNYHFILPDREFSVISSRSPRYCRSNCCFFITISFPLLLWPRQSDTYINSYYYILLLLINEWMISLEVALTVLPLNVAYTVLGRWIFGSITCKVWLTADVLCCTASILNLCAIALDRWEERGVDGGQFTSWEISLQLLMEAFCTSDVCLCMQSHSIIYITY